MRRFVFLPTVQEGRIPTHHCLDGHSVRSQLEWFLLIKVEPILCVVPCPLILLLTTASGFTL